MHREAAKRWRDRHPEKIKEQHSNPRYNYRSNHRYTNSEIIRKYQEALHSYNQGELAIDIARQLDIDYARILTWIRGKWRPREFKPLHHMTEGEKGFIAGLIEGEGTITLVQNKWGNAVCRISIANTNRKLIQKAQEIIGGESHIFIHKKQHPNWRISYTLAVAIREQIIQLLSLVGPYLVGKKRQALILAQFCKSRLSHPKRQSPYTEEEYKLIQRMGEANGRENNKGGLTKKKRINPKFLPIIRQKDLASITIHE